MHLLSLFFNFHTLNTQNVRIRGENQKNQLDTSAKLILPYFFYMYFFLKSYQNIGGTTFGNNPPLAGPPTSVEN